MGRLALYRDLTAALPDEFTVFGGLVHAPDGSGTKLVAIVLCHCGPLADGERAVADQGLWCAGDGCSWADAVLPDKHDARRRLSPWSAIAITNNRILAVDDATVTYRYKDRAADRQRKETVSGHEFIRALPPARPAGRLSQGPLLRPVASPRAARPGRAT